MEYIIIITLYYVTLKYWKFYKSVWPTKCIKEFGEKNTFYTHNPKNSKVEIKKFNVNMTLGFNFNPIILI